MKILSYAIPLLASLIFILIGLEIVLPIFRPEMEIFPILLVNALFVVGSYYYLIGYEKWHKPEDYQLFNKILLAVYILSFIAIMIFLVLYFALDISRPVFYDLIILEIGLGIISSYSLKLF